MDEFTRTIPATLDYFMGWLQSYMVADREAKRQGWRFKRDILHNYFHEGIQHQHATITGALTGSRVNVPLVEVDAEQRQRVCTVTLRCNEAALTEWFQALRVAMVEKWREVRATDGTAAAEIAPLPDASVIGGLYGTDRDLTIDDVRDIVRRCREFQKRGGKVPEFYRREGLVESEKGFYTLNTLRGWLKNHKFKD